MRMRGPRSRCRRASLASQTSNFSFDLNRGAESPARGNGRYQASGSHRSQFNAGEPEDGERDRQQGDRNADLGALGEAEIDAEIGGAFDDADAGKAADQQQICTHPVKATG
jgi:hypothetical protein